MANPKPRLLLVDDDPSLLRLLTLRLEGEGYQVISADSAEAALPLLAKHSIDVVIDRVVIDKSFLKASTPEIRTRLRQVGTPSPVPATGTH